MSPKEYYQNYLADDNLSELSEQLIHLIAREKPVHVLDFGCGTGKHLLPLYKSGISAIGMDISILNVIHAYAKGLPCIVKGDEKYLRNFVNVDVVFTCSVLDHIEDIDGIIQEFKRIANKAVYLAETRDIVGPHYFDHDYTAMGFRRLPFEWRSTEGDGATYYIWVWHKQKDNDMGDAYDDLATSRR